MDRCWTHHLGRRIHLPREHYKKQIMRSLACVFLLLIVTGDAWAAGARLYKSGSIQISADGATVWMVNSDSDSVSRMDTTTRQLSEFPLPDPGTKHVPLGLAVSDDGSRIWVACHDSDRVYVLNSAGALVQRIDLPWGTGPAFVALSPPVSGNQHDFAVVSGMRGGSLHVFNGTTRALIKQLDHLFKTPYAIAFSDDGSAWISHLFADGEHTRLSRLTFNDPMNPLLDALFRVTPANPQQGSSTAPRPAEGGYLTPRGHMAQVPAGMDGGRLWMTTQYQNIHNDVPNPDAVVQSVIRKVNLARRQIVGGGNFASNPDHPAKIIASAVDVHSPVGTPVFDGPGWDAQVSGPIDLGFSSDGLLGYLLHEQSEDILVLPTDTPPVKPAPAAPLAEIEVGKRPTGLVLAPDNDLAYVNNRLSRSVSVVDLSIESVIDTIATTPVTGSPFSGVVQRGAEIFHSSNEDAISLNRKVACASCHYNAEHDGRGWDLQYLPGNHGPRATQNLGGLNRSFGPVDPITGWGQLHRSGDRDEVQDFEHTFQGPQMGGNGFAGAAVNPELGMPNAGISPDLDALAAYLMILDPVMRSPYRAADGSLTDAAVRGATIFSGTNSGTTADGLCAGCHLPASGFQDFAFHDVGQAVRPGENELQNRNPPNHVNTAPLLDLWMTWPHDGVVGYAESLMGALLDFRNRPGARAPHGRLDNLTGRQMFDLRQFLRSIDGNLSAAEVSNAIDNQAPAIRRVSVTALDRIEVWFDEAVDPATASDPGAWALQASGGAALAINSVTFDGQNSDRVTLHTDAMSCGPTAYELTPVGPIDDLAGQVSGGTTNTLVQGLPAQFSVSEDLTITFGASGEENLTVPVHDAATLSGLTNWSHGSVWMVPNGSNPSTAFLRFEWANAFAQVTGLSDPAALLDASITLSPEFGGAQNISAWRVLQAWYDHRGPDFNNNPVDPVSGRGGPTWNESERNVQSWNQTNARARSPGVEGDQPGDYFGSQDTANTPDFTVNGLSLNEPVVLSGGRLLDALRFWLQNPNLDFGYALRIPPNTSIDYKFTGSEHDLSEHSPVLTLTYATGCDSGYLFGDSFE